MSKRSYIIIILFIILFLLFFVNYDFFYNNLQKIIKIINDVIDLLIEKYEPEIFEFCYY